MANVKSHSEAVIGVEIGGGAARRMSAWVDSVGDVDGCEHSERNDLNIGVVFDF